MNKDWQNAQKVLNKDGVVVLPTDTLYGLVGSALSKKAVERIYKIKNRDSNKPLIVLISSLKDLDIFNVYYGNKNWPSKTSIILSCSLQKFSYLHRGTKSIAFRMISSRNKNLFNLLKKVGPLVAPSANPESKSPAYSILEAKNYFGNQVDFYINGGKRQSKPSTLISLIEEKPKILRK